MKVYRDTENSIAMKNCLRSACNRLMVESGYDVFISKKLDELNEPEKKQKEDMVKGTGQLIYLKNLGKNDDAVNSRKLEPLAKLCSGWSLSASCVAVAAMG